MRSSLGLGVVLLLAGLSPARAAGVAVRVEPVGPSVPALPLGFPETLHPGFAQSPAALQLNASLLSPRPVESFHAELLRLGAADPAALAAEKAAALQAAGVRFVADYNALAAAGATPQAATEWLGRPEQLERLAVLTAHRDLLVRGGNAVLQGSMDALAARDQVLMARVRELARALDERRRAEALEDGRAPVLAAATSAHRNGLLPAPVTTAPVVRTEPAPPDAPRGPTDAQFAKAVKAFLAIAGSVVAGALAWIGAGHLGFVDPRPGVEFLTVYGVELSLSADNLVAFAAILAPVALKLSPKAAQRILQTGLWGALVLRVAASLLGLKVLAAFGGLAMLGGGAVLVLLAAKILLPEKYSPLHVLGSAAGRLFAPLARRLRRRLAALKARLAARAGGKARFAALAVVAGAVLAVALTDVTFAVDSIPTALGLTKNAGVIVLANVASVLGLSQLYVILQKTADRFHLVNKGVGAALTVVAAKMLLEAFHLWTLPLLPSAAVVMAPILIALALSLLKRPAAGS